MVKNYLTILVFFIVSISYAQEICNNAIDDDNDALIDLNDPDCNCAGTVAEVPSLIPNPSFEEFDYCPSSYSQLDGATSWVQATTATSDYFNTCGYAPNTDMQPYPDGNASVGGFFLTDYKEYVGAELNTPMLANTPYQLKFYIASVPTSNSGALATSNNGIIDYGPLDITIFGTASNPNFPLSTFDCPSDFNSQWFVLGTVNYTPTMTWEEITINFTPGVDIQAIVLGSPCTLPPGYPSLSDINQVGYAAYFYFDGLILNEESFFNGVTVSSTGDFCSDNVVLHSDINNPEGSETFQWYSNGIAIIGATNANLAVADFIPGTEYSVVVTSGENCFRSEPLELDTILPDPPTVVTPLSYCQNDSTAALSATGSNLLWYTSASGGTGTSTAPTPSSAAAGTFIYYVSQTCELEGTRAAITVTVNPVVTPDFAAIEPVCAGIPAWTLDTTAPNGTVGIWTPATVDTSTTTVYTFQPTGPCSELQQLTIEVIAPLEFSIAGYCNLGSFYLEASPTAGEFDPTTSFQWLDQNLQPIGADDPLINITAIVNSTMEQEIFPLTYNLTVTDSFGCDQTQPFTIQKVFCTIPKGVSVNDDQQNDYFNLNGLNVRHLDIYNRYGMVVYSRANYVAEWKGQSDSGDELPEGTYYYHLQFDDEASKTGWVYLIRKN